MSEKSTEQITEHKSDCIICAQKLIYGQEAMEKECGFCKTRKRTEVFCVNGHFICDHCHRLRAMDYIEEACVNSTLTDPLLLATQIMQHPSVKMHGPEHHFLVPAVLFSVLHQSSAIPGKKREMIKRARGRAEKVPGGFCGSHGNCGSAVGTGIFVSLHTLCTPLSTQAWQQSNTMTALSLSAIAKKGGPRCCKRTCYTAITTAVDYANQYYGARITAQKPVCLFSDLNHECQKTDCEYYFPACKPQGS